MLNLIRNYKTFVLIVLVVIVSLLCGVIIGRAAERNVQRGLAMVDWSHPEDRSALGVSWYYGWGEFCSDDPDCVNMVRGMQPPKACYGFLLVGNEPNAIEPYGAPVNPYFAAKSVIAIQKQCPLTRLVVGNVSVDDWSIAGGWGSGLSWVKSFLYHYQSLAKKPYADAIGVHCYTQHLADYCVQELKKLRKAHKGAMWVTEFGVMSGDLDQFNILLDYIAENFTKYAAYTNRQPHTGQGWEISTKVELVNSDGSLSAIGLIYSK